MCTVISSGPCNCSSTSGVSAGAVAAVVAVASTLGFGFLAFRAHPVLLTALYLLVVLAYWQRRVLLALLVVGLVRLRSLMWRGTKHVAVLAWRKVRPASTALVAAEQPWRVTLYARVPGGMSSPIGEATVTGRWRTAAELEAETIRRYIAASGHPAPAALACRAELLPRAA